MANYTYISKDKSKSIAHYGVLGMKWGHRKARPISDRRMERIARRNRELTAKNNALLANNRLYQKTGRAVNRNLDKTMGFNERKRDRTKAYNRAQMKRTQTRIDYQIAKNKAKMDKSYKNSAEYRRAKTAHGKQLSQDLLFGTTGSIRIDQYKEMGKTNKQAKATVFAQQLLEGAALGALAVGSFYLTNKKYS